MSLITLRTVVYAAFVLLSIQDGYGASAPESERGASAPPTRSDAAPEDRIEEMVVVGAYAPRERTTVDGSMTLIEPAAFAPGASLPTLLASVPNLAVARSGGAGQLAEVRLRGGEANHTVVLLDGVVANDPATGSALDFSQLIGGGISRVEVLKGAQSTRYGSEAISGAINILAQEPPLGSGWTFGASTGSHRLRQADATWSLADAGRFVRLFVDRRLADGFSVSRIEPERDGFRATTATVSAGLDTGPWTFRSTLRSIDKLVENDVQDFAFPPRSTQGLVVDADERGRSTVRMLHVSAAREGAVSQRASVSLLDSRHRQLNGADRVGEISAERVRASYELARSWGAHRAVAAFDVEQTRFANYSAAFAAANYGRTERQWSAAVEYRLERERLTGTLGIRHDRNRRFRDATTYRVGATYQLHRHIVAFASVGSGITNPTFFERFGFFPASFIGNPSLEPESSVGADIGLRVDRGAWRWEAAIFNASLLDEITTQFDFSTFTSSPINRQGRSKRRGAELSGHWSNADWTIDVSAAYLDAREPDDRIEVRRPRREASLMIERRWAFVSAYLSGRYSGGLRDVEFVQATSADRAWLDDYVIVDAGLSFRWRPQLDGFLRIENLLDRDVEEVFGYATMPRAVVAGIRLTRG